MKSDKCSFFCISIIKSPKNLKQFNQVIIIMEEKMIVIRDPRTIFFSFDGPKDVHDNLKLDNEIIIKSNAFLAENKTKNEIRQLLLKYKHVSNTHELSTKNSKTNELHKCVFNFS